jgi:hypothetical protein
MNLRDPLVAYRHFRSSEMSEAQSSLLAEMFSDPKSFLEVCKSSLVLFRKLRDVGFLEKASLQIDTNQCSHSRPFAANKDSTQRFGQTTS